MSVLCMEGGGFRAQSVDTGFMVGMLAFLGQEQKSKAPTLAGTGLLNSFSSFSTNSGSSWFFSELAYSSRFSGLVESMAKEPTSAAALYKAGWTNDWLEATGVDPSKFNLLGDLARLLISKVLGSGDEDSIFMLQYFLATGFEWDRFVDVLLNSTSSLLPTTPVGSTAATAAWAKAGNKKQAWLIDHSMIASTGAVSARMHQGKLGYPRVSYHVEAKWKGTVPTYVPAMFSSRLGGGMLQSAPYRYASADAVADLAALKYTAAPVPGLEHKASEPTSSLGADFANHGLTRHVGKLPVTRLAACSSAFIGAACVDETAAEITALVGGNVCPWASNAPDGQSFAHANALVEALGKIGGADQKSVDGLAAAGVHSLIDGQYTDGTAIANAIAAGATDVVAVLNSIRNVSAPATINATAERLTRLFHGGPPPSVSHSSLLHPRMLQVFGSPTADGVLTDLRSFHQLELPTGTSYLTQIAVGTIEATTAANVYYGVGAGRKVNVHVVAIGSSLNIGEFENFQHYDQLAQEIALALVAKPNAAFVRDTMLPMFLGKSEAVEQA